MSYTPPLYSLPTDKHKIHKKIRQKLKIENPQLMYKFTNRSFSSTILFLQGYYSYMIKDLMPPYKEEEVIQHLIEEGYKFLVELLQE